MLSGYKNGYGYHSDGQCINITTEDGRVIISYHPIYGEQICGVNTPKQVVEATEVLQYVQQLSARPKHPIQCE